MHSSQAQQAFHIASGLEDIAAAQCCYHHGYNNTALKKTKKPRKGLPEVPSVSALSRRDILLFSVSASVCVSDAAV